MWSSLRAALRESCLLSVIADDFFCCCASLNFLSALASVLSCGRPGVRYSVASSRSCSAYSCMSFVTSRMCSNFSSSESCSKLATVTLLRSRNSASCLSRLYVCTSDI